MDMKDVEKECLTRSGDISELRQRIVALEARTKNLENKLNSFTLYALATLASVVGFFVKTFIGGLPK